LSQSYVFIADIHITPGNSERVERFCTFLDMLEAEKAGRLYILGDLFEMWIGRGNEREPDYARVLARIAQLTQAGVETIILHGNRDFLMGRGVEQITGGRIAGQQEEITLDGRTVHLCHGDHLCEKDSGYQKLRAFLRHRFFSRAFQLLPYFVRRLLANSLRSISRRTLAAKSQETVGYPQDVLERLFSNGIDIVICGHTHIEHCESINSNGRSRTFYNLGDWGTTGAYLVYAGGTFQLRNFQQ